MNQLLTLKTWLIIVCILCLSAGYVLGEGDDAAYVYGEPPSGGKILLKLVNNEEELDAIAVITKGGEKTPLLAIYIPSDEVGSIEKMEKGRYDVYFTTGIDWNEDNVAFNDGRYYKLKSPLILGAKSEYQVQLFADEGKLGTRIKHIDESVFPDISGPSYSDSDSDESDSWSSGDKPASAPSKSTTG